MLSNEEIEKLIEDMTKVRPEMLNEEALKLFNTIMKIIEEIETLIKERDYYKQRYLEFNDYFIKNNMTIEQMIKDLKRSKLYERSTEDDIQSKEDTGTNKLCRRTLDRERTEHSKNDNI